MKKILEYFGTHQRTDHSSYIHRLITIFCLTLFTKTITEQVYVFTFIAVRAMQINGTFWKRNTKFRGLKEIAKWKMGYLILHKLFKKWPKYLHMLHNRFESLQLHILSSSFGWNHYIHNIRMPLRWLRRNSYHFAVVSLHPIGIHWFAAIGILTKRISMNNLEIHFIPCSSYYSRSDSI